MGDRRQGLAAVPGDADTAARMVKHAADDEAVELIVFDHQHMHHRLGFCRAHQGHRWQRRSHGPRQLAQAADQGRSGDRLDQLARQMLAVERAVHHGRHIGAHTDQAIRRDQVHDLVNELTGIDLVDVQQHPRARLRAHRGQPLAQLGGAVAPHSLAAQALQEGLQGLGTGVVWLDVGHAVTQRRGLAGRHLGRGQGQIQHESRTHTQRAVDMALAAHGLRQLAHDGQAQTSAAKAPVGAVISLPKRVEDVRQ